jgi:hypothetical protein
MNDKQMLDLYGKIVEQLVKTADNCLKLSEKEKDLIIEGAFNGLNNVLNRRYIKTLNKTRVHKIRCS